MSTLSFAPRFQGPPRSANGGYVAGALVEAGFGLDAGTYTVRLSRPPRLDVDHAVAETETGFSLSDGDDLVATARRAERDLEPVTAVDRRRAGRAEAGYAGLISHPFGACFGCGPGSDGGLRIFAGPVEEAVEGRRRVAAVLTAVPELPRDPADEQRVSLATAWSALDCASGWAAHIDEQPIVLGEMTASVTTLPRIDEHYVVVAEQRARQGRRVQTACSLYFDDGTLMGTAEHTWIAIDPADFT